MHISGRLPTSKFFFSDPHDVVESPAMFPSRVKVTEVDYLEAQTDRLVRTHASMAVILCRQ